MDYLFEGLQDLLPPSEAGKLDGIFPFVPDYGYLSEFSSGAPYCSGGGQSRKVTLDPDLPTKLQLAQTQISILRDDKDRMARENESLRANSLLLERRLDRAARKLERKRREYKIVKDRLRRPLNNANRILARISDQRDTASAKHYPPLDDNDKRQEQAPAQKKRKTPVIVPSRSCIGGKVFARPAGFSFGRGQERAALGFYDRSHCHMTCARCKSMKRFYKARSASTTREANGPGGLVEQLIATLKTHIVLDEPSCMWNQCKGANQPP